MFDAIITIPVTKEVQAKIKKLAKEQEISMNQFCREAIKIKINENEKKVVAKRKKE